MGDSLIDFVAAMFVVAVVLIVFMRSDAAETWFVKAVKWTVGLVSAVAAALWAYIIGGGGQ